MEPDTLTQLAKALADRYDIGREIGSGGMAIVYLAYDRRHDRHVAIKVLRREFAAAVGAERFLAEIRVTASLHHPHILTLIDSGEVDGRPYYVLPFVPGESVRELLVREPRLPVDTALSITAQVVSALAHAHSRGVVHRDVKPANILLQDGNAFLADFGIALALESSRGRRLTEAGMSVGTPDYMSPEQVRGDPTIDGRGDVYALAAVLFEMLAGEPLFEGTSPFAVVAKVVTEPAPSVRVLRPDVPSHVADAIDKALSKSAADRFPTIAAFGDALRVPSGGARRGHLVSRRAGRAMAGFVMLLATLAAGRYTRVGDGWFGSSMPSAHQRVAVLFAPTGGDDPDVQAIANGLMGDLIDSLQHVPGLHVVPASRLAPYRDGLTLPDSVARALAVGAIIQASIERRETNFRIAVWLVEAATGVRSTTRTMEASVADLLPIRSELTRTVLALLAEKPRAPRGATSTEAWLLLQRARDLERRVDSLPAAQATATLAAADSMLDAAERIESAWPALILERGQVAYRLSRIGGPPSDDSSVRRFKLAAAQRAIRAADRILAMEPLNARAYALRGTARYWIWISQMSTDTAQRNNQFMSAKFDVERAVDLDTKLTDAWTTLSDMYARLGDAMAVNRAARKAYAADPYVDGARIILLRLFNSAYDMELFAQADSTCAEIRRRFPSDLRAARCRLVMLTEPTKSPDVAEAWSLADSMVARTPDSTRNRTRRSGDMLVAAVIARVAASQPPLADSARRVAGRAREGAVELRRQLTSQAAYVHTLLGDNQTAIDLLIESFGSNPMTRSGFASNPYWWFRGLKADTGFKRLIRPAR